MNGFTAQGAHRKHDVKQRLGLARNAEHGGPAEAP